MFAIIDALFTRLRPDYHGLSAYLPDSRRSQNRIPAMGTKFTKATELGPSGQKGKDRLHWDDEGTPIHVWFDFRSGDR